MRIIDKKASTVQELIDLLQSLPKEAKSYTLDYGVIGDGTKSILVLEENKQIHIDDLCSLIENMEWLDEQNEVDDAKILYIRRMYMQLDLCMSEMLRTLLHEGWFVTDAEIVELLAWAGESDICVGDVRERKGA